MGSPEAILLADLLKEISAAARLVELTEAPDGPWYSLRVEIAGAIAKDLVAAKVAGTGCPHRSEGAPGAAKHLARGSHDAAVSGRD